MKCSPSVTGCTSPPFRGGMVGPQLPAVDLHLYEIQCLDGPFLVGPSCPSVSSFLACTVRGYGYLWWGRRATLLSHVSNNQARADTTSLMQWTGCAVRTYKITLKSFFSKFILGTSITYAWTPWHPLSLRPVFFVHLLSSTKPFCLMTITMMAW